MLRLCLVLITLSSLLVDSKPVEHGFEIQSGGRQPRSPKGPWRPDSPDTLPTDLAKIIMSPHLSIIIQALDHVEEKAQNAAAIFRAKLGQAREAARKYFQTSNRKDYIRIAKVYEQIVQKARDWKSDTEVLEYLNKWCIAQSEKLLHNRQTVRSKRRRAGLTIGPPMRIEMPFRNDAQLDGEENPQGESTRNQVDMSRQYSGRSDTHLLGAQSKQFIDKASTPPIPGRKLQPNVDKYERRLLSLSKGQPQLLDAEKEITHALPPLPKGRSMTNEKDQTNEAQNVTEKEAWDALRAEQLRRQIEREKSEQHKLDKDVDEVLANKKGGDRRNNQNHSYLQGSSKWSAGPLSGGAPTFTNDESESYYTELYNEDDSDYLFDVVPKRSLHAQSSRGASAQTIREQDWQQQQQSQAERARNELRQASRPSTSKHAYQSMNDDDAFSFSPLPSSRDLKARETPHSPRQPESLESVLNRYEDLLFTALASTVSIKLDTNSSPQKITNILPTTKPSNGVPTAEKRQTSDERSARWSLSSRPGALGLLATSFSFHKKQPGTPTTPNLTAQKGRNHLLANNNLNGRRRQSAYMLFRGTTPTSATSRILARARDLTREESLTNAPTYAFAANAFMSIARDVVEHDPVFCCCGFHELTDWEYYIIRHRCSKFAWDCFQSWCARPGEAW